MSGYQIVDTQETVYQDETRNVINGVLVRYRATAYGEIHEVRVARMDVNLVKAAIEKQIAERDKIAALGAVEE